MTGAKCPQQRLAGPAKKGDMATCPVCGRDLRVVEYKRAEGMVPHIPPHTSGAITSERPSVAPGSPQTAQPVVMGRVRLPDTVTGPRAREHEWVPAGNDIECRRGKSCGVWPPQADVFAVCRRCGMCWYDDSGVEGCPGGSVRWPTANLIPAGA